MIRRPPRSTRTYTLFPYTTLFRSLVEVEVGQRAQQQRLAGARGPAQRDALAGGQLEGGRFQAGTRKVSDGEHGGGRLRHRHAAVPPLTWLRERPSGGSPGPHLRSEERRVGKECVRTGRIRGSA